MSDPIELQELEEQDLLWGEPVATDDLALWGTSDPEPPVPQPELPIDRTPSLREFAGYGDRPVSIEEAIGGGDLNRYIEFLRDRARGVAENSDEQKELAGNISRLREAQVEFDRLSDLARRRGVTVSEVQRQEFSAEAEQRFTEALGPIIGPGLRAVASGAETGTEAVISEAERLASKAKMTAQETMIMVGLGGLVGDQISPVFADPRQIAKNAQLRASYQEALDRQAGLEDVLGETGATIFKSLTESVPKYMAASMAGGPAAVYSLIAAEGHNRGLNEADDNGFTGFKREGYALTVGAIETATTYMLGRVAARRGYTTLEEAASPGLKNLASSLLTRRGVKEGVTKAFKRSTGSFLEGVEEGVIDGATQVAEFIAGIDGSEYGFDWGRFFTAVGAGVFGGEAANTLSALAQGAEIDPESESNLVAGALAAEEAVSIVTDESLNLPTAQARRFFERFEPSAVMKVLDAELSPEQFAEVTGLQDTTPEFRESFRETLQIYKPFLDAKAVADAARSAEAVEPGPGERGTERADKEGTPTADRGSDNAQATDTTESKPSTAEPVAEAERQPADRPETTIADQPTPGVPSNPARARAIELALNVPIQARRVALVRDALDEGDTTPQLAMDSIRQVMNEVVPEGPARADLIAQAARVETKAGANKMFDRVMQEIRAYDHRTAKKELREALKDAQNMRKEFRDIKESLTGGINMDNKATQRQISALKNRLSKSILPPSSKDQAALDRLSRMRDVNDMTPVEIRGVAHSLLLAAKQNQDKNLLLQSQFNEFVEDVANEIVGDATKVRKIKQTTAPANLQAAVPSMLRSRAVEVSPRRKFLSIDSPLLREGFSRLEDLLRPFGKLRELIWEDTFIQPDSVAKRYERDELLEMEDVLRRNGLETGGVAMEGLTLKSSGLEQWRSELRRVNNTELTRDEALLVHLVMRDPELAIDARNHGFKFGKRNRDLQVDENTEQEILDFIGPEGVDIVDHMFEQLNGRIVDRINASWEVVNGYPLTDRQLHVPRPSDPDAIHQDEGTPFAQRLVDNIELDSYGHLKERGGSGKAITIPEKQSGGLDFYLSHAERMNRISAYLVPYRNARTILDRDDVKSAVTSVGGDALMDNLNQALEMQVVPFRPEPSLGFPKTQKAIRRATGNLKASIVALSPTAMLLPTVGVITSAAQEEGGFRRLPEAVARSLVPGERSRAKQLAFEHSPAAWHRWKRGNYSGEITGGFLTDRSFFRPRGVTDVFSRLLSFFEQEISLPARWFMAEDYVKKQGMNPNDPAFNDFVARQFERSLYRGENSSEAMEMSGALRFANDNGVAAPFVAFMNAASKQYSAGLSSLDQVRQGISDNDARVIAAGMGKLIGVSAGFMVEGIIRELFSFEEVPGDYPARIAKRTASGAITTMPVVGEILDQKVMRPVLDMKQYPDDGDLLTSSAKDVISGFTEAGIQLTNGIPDSNKEKEQFAMALWNTAKLFQFAGVPVRGVQQVGRRISGAADEGVEGVLPGLDR